MQIHIFPQNVDTWCTGMSLILVFLCSLGGELTTQNLNDHEQKILAYIQVHCTCSLRNVI